MKQKLNAAIKAYSFETEFRGGCLSCGKDIRHPVCPFCLAEAFRQWISGFPEEEKKILKQLDKFLGAHEHFGGRSKICVACGKSTVHLCPYCFTDYLYKIVRKAGLGVRALSEFLFIFNFDFDHDGYSRELEAFGGY